MIQNAGTLQRADARRRSRLDNLRSRYRALICAQIVAPLPQAT
jgi:hypothetical protein